MHFCMLQFISVDSPTLSVNEKDHGHLWVECALHFFVHDVTGMTLTLRVIGIILDASFTNTPDVVHQLADFPKTLFAWLAKISR